jgi:hypothetical protein
MLLFVPTTFEDFADSPYDPTLSQLLAAYIMIVSIGALILTLGRALFTLLMGAPLDGFGPPPSHHLMLGI